MARPTLLTPELSRKITELLRQGHYRQDVLASLNVAERTYYHWLERGKAEESGVHHDFVLACEAAVAESKLLGLSIINKAAMTGEWRAMAWKLERTWNAQFGEKVRIEVQEKIQESLLERLRQGLDPETFARCLECILAEDSAEVPAVPSEH